MPTNPVNPTSNAAVDRLTLGVESPRGNAASTNTHYFGSTPCNCFEVEASAAAGVCGRCFCFEADASGISLCACGCACSEIED